MNTLKSFCMITILAFAWYSCNNEETDFVPSQTIVIMEGEGGTKLITFETNDWRLTSVVNKNGGQKIFGNIFDQDGKLIKENSLLELNELGKIDASWLDKGFNITRNTPNSLQIELYENATEEEFSFAIIIENEGQINEITVVQKICEGYTFEGLEYFLAENDGDTFYVTESNTYTHSISKPMEIEISPFGGINIMNTSYFVSDNYYAFVWFKEDLIEVNVPSSIVDDKIYLSNEKKIYGKISKNWDEEYGTVKEKLLIPEGESKFHVELEWRNRQVSYKLTMKNKRTGDLKIVEGKWIETTPTGIYTIIRDY
ncbi:hypothetical protein [Parabacteroides sp. Marseille-P3160]|uniref:hypothetical protein n=1 Tax=Parabacteroides sp. Marseille-P3160 TaxID=1917887 RepID=UPI00111A4BE2|nr:hypothetical protein [Parabacteroides sp. Marseille-P3160]